MAKHVADKPHTPSKGGRAKHFTGIERAEAGPREQTRKLQQRPRDARDETRRAREFLRIERGERA